MVIRPRERKRLSCYCWLVLASIGCGFEVLAVVPGPPFNKSQTFYKSKKLTSLILDNFQKLWYNIYRRLREISPFWENLTISKSYDIIYIERKKETKNFSESWKTKNLTKIKSYDIIYIERKKEIQNFFKNSRYQRFDKSQKL